VVIIKGDKKWGQMVSGGRMDWGLMVGRRYKGDSGKRERARRIQIGVLREGRRETGRICDVVVRRTLSLFRRGNLLSLS
jgi:hypothetical protein